MADQNRNQSSQKSGQQRSAQSPSRPDNESEMQQTQGNRNNQSDSLRADDMTSDRSSPSERGRSNLDTASMADDRGAGADRARRGFSGEREGDELGREINEEIDLEDSDEDLGGSGGRSNR